MVGSKAAVAAVAAVLVSTAVAQDAVSSSQYWHERYHGILSMAAYGDYDTLCPQQTFTQAALAKSFPDSTEAPWTNLGEWGPTASGLSGFNVIIPEMDKVVMVFRTINGWQGLNMTATNVNPSLNIGSCTNNCTVNAAALQAYLEAKEATNDWATVKQAVASTGHQWSVTGWEFGGMVAQVAALDLGWRNLCHWSHSHGAPRVFNAGAASVYDSLFQGEAGQRTVANNDAVIATIPESADYTMTLQGFHITGDGVSNSTYGMSYTVCNEATDPECLGAGNNITDHYFYYTGYGNCGGSPYQYNAAQQNQIAASLGANSLTTATTAMATSTSTLSSALSSMTMTTVMTSIPTSTMTSTAGAMTSTNGNTVVVVVSPTTASQAAASAGTQSASNGSNKISGTGSFASGVFVAVSSLIGAFLTL